MPEQVTDCPDWLGADDLPNLDCFVDPGTLSAIEVDVAEVIKGLEMFKDYAHRKAVAMQSRLDGNTGRAVEIEESLDLLYARMPEWAKW